MKDEDILLPQMPEGALDGRGDVWKSIVKWHKEDDSDDPLWRNVDKAIVDLIHKQCREAVRMNKDVWQRASEEYKARAAELNHNAPSPLPFSLEAAKRGEPLVTRDGRKANYVGYADGVAYPLVVLIDGNAVVSVHSDSGKSSFTCDTDNRSDLFLAPKPKQTVWVNILSSQNRYEDGESAFKIAVDSGLHHYFAVAVPIQIDDIGGAE